MIKEVQNLLDTINTDYEEIVFQLNTVEEDIKCGLTEETIHYVKKSQKERSLPIKKSLKN